MKYLQTTSWFDNIPTVPVAPLDPRSFKKDRLPNNVPASYVRAEKKTQPRDIWAESFYK